MGSVKQIVAPGVRSATQISPPCLVTMFFAIARPRPVPPSPPVQSGPSTDELRAQLARDPFRVEIYRAMRKLHLDRGEIDKAYCVDCWIGAVYLPDA